MVSFLVNDIIKSIIGNVDLCLAEMRELAVRFSRQDKFDLDSEGQFLYFRIVNFNYDQIQTEKQFLKHTLNRYLLLFSCTCLTHTFYEDLENFIRGSIRR